jgi:peptide-methionine (S)-S-oxide reductase
VEIFWDSHDPTSQSWSQQYREALFYHDKEQKKIAESTMKQLSASIKNRIRTHILPFTGFYLAEDYHQKHNLRGYPELLDEFSQTYPSVEGLVSSTAVSRVNGYLGDNGRCDQLKSEIDDFGLSERGTNILIEAVCGGSIGSSCSTKTCRK